MSRLRDKRARAGHLGLATAAITVAACLTVPGTAMAGQDDLKGGSVEIALAGSHGLRLSPASLQLPISGGAIDPIDGSGTVAAAGAFKLKRGKRTTKVKIIGLSFGANGGPGSIAAKVNKRKVRRFAVLSGGSVTRDGWGARISGVTAVLGPKGNRALASRAKGGQRLGTVSATTVPRSVEVLPGGTLVFKADNGFANKLLAHCITPLGVAAIPPATQNLTQFTFPVTGGSISPAFDAGNVISDGGQTIAKDNNLSIPFTCNQGPPVGTKVIQTQFQAQFALQALASNTVLPDGPVGIAGLGIFDLSAAKTSADVDTKQITITDAPIHLDGLSAFILNQVFPNESGDPNNDFAGGDLLGTMSLSVKTH
jgi:hypothetical protein